MEEASNARYWCHACSRTVIPVMAVEIECPRCHTGFVEQMGGAVDDDDLVSDRALSLLAPILLGMLANRNPRTESQDEDAAAADDDGAGDDGAGDPRRPQRRSPAFVRLLRRSDPENPSREGDRIILISPFRQAILLDDPGRGITIGDYFVGQGLDQLLQQLGEGDPSKYGTPPARKEAVEAMPRVRVEEAATCAVCLEELAVGEEAREMPCAHRFHGACIVPWLGLHGSCPVCRYQMPVEEEAKEPSNGGGGEGVNGGESGNGGGGEHGRRLWVPLPWPLSTLFSSSEAAGAAETESHGSSASSGSDS
ncbi:E3 ubiquitin-protein ligase RING1 [Ananas comosus]|uniref:RING-type E3 ubiquitin transferase n=1 Tax=Ananas comosus TaxID=4615 RepID=A0A199V7D6_ANACO|nr:E3 ubiquitin-protein ligase RING1 [Ananas comosus]